LIQSQIQPSAKLKTHLPDGAASEKTKVFVKRDARFVVRVDGANQDLVIERRAAQAPIGE
jgi:hypothetical protein